MTGFRFSIENLKSLYRLSISWEDVVTKVQDQNFTLTIDSLDPDKSGPYFQGNRCYLRDTEQVDLYVYLGIMFNYKKNQKGLFIEVDAFNNSKYYDLISENITSDDKYILWLKDEGFIKLFMKDEDIEEINNAENIDQQNQLFAEFIHYCCKKFVLLARK